METVFENRVCFANSFTKIQTWTWENSVQYWIPST